MKKWKFILFLFLFLLFGCSLIKEEKYNYKDYIVDDKLILLIENDFNSEKDLNIKIDFYFNEDVINTFERKLYGLLDNSCALDFGKVEFEYDYYKINLNYSNSSGKNVVDNIVLNNEVTEHLIKSKIDNNTKNNVKMCLSVVYYKDHKVVGIDEEKDFDISSNNTYETFFYYPSESFDNLEFDNYKFYINEAYY